jgi:uncharacterized membrane protein YbaN (DUF454 family)
LSKEIEVCYEREGRCLEALSKQKAGQVIEAEKEQVAKSNPQRVSRISDRLFRGALVFAGTCFLALGILGVFLPLLPTTPFLLLAVACYARSSKRFYYWLLNNRLFGSYIKNYHEGRGISLKLKVITLALLWGTITYSAFFVVDALYWRIILLVIAVGVTIHILKTRTLRQEG